MLSSILKKAGRAGVEAPVIPALTKDGALGYGKPYRPCPRDYRPTGRSGRSGRSAAWSAAPVPAGQVRKGDLLVHDGRELLVTGTHGTWYREDGRPVAGLAVECRSGSAWWILYRRGSELLSRVRTGDGIP